MKPENQCPICLKQESALLFDDGRDYFVADGKSGDFSVWFCPNCQIGYSTPFLTDAELQQYYPADFEAYVPKKSFSGYLQKVKYRQDLRKIQRALKVKSGSGMSLFEIGAGRGEFLSEAKKQGFEVAGIEPGQQGIGFAKEQYNIYLEQHFASELKFNQKYDVIVMRHVLEHLNDFKNCLQKIFEKGLKNGGLLFVKVPNMESWEAKLFGKYWHGFDLPRHRYHFTPIGIGRILKNMGYNYSKIYNENIPVDCVRSIFYYQKFSSGLWSKILTCIVIIPKKLLIMLITPLITILSFLINTGRIIIIGKK